MSTPEAKALSERYREDRNLARPHGSRGHGTPAKFAALCMPPDVSASALQASVDRQSEKVKSPMNPIPYIRGLHRYRVLHGRPVIVGGCERSGTTLLQAILSSHPRILAIPEETWALADSEKSGLADGRVVRLERLWKGLGAAQREATHRRWAEKSPANIFQFGSILDYFGGTAQLIQIVRDGRDVVSSIHPDKDTPWVPVQRWIDAVLAGLPYLDHPDVLTIRYEDCVLHPVRTIREVFEFLDAEIEGRDEEEQNRWLGDWVSRARIRSSPNLRSRDVKAIHTQSVQKWREPDFPWTDRVRELEAHERSALLLELHGYGMEGSHIKRASYSGSIT